jgi:hypothetical protein
MEQQKEHSEIKEYADGWIRERKGTDAPIFLKLAFIVIAGGALAYLVIYMNGETTHSDRGALVQRFNEVTKTADGFMYGVAAIVVIFAALVVGFAFKTFHEE